MSNLIFFPPELLRWDFGIDADKDDGEAEPTCRCDIQRLANRGHDASCGWLKWNQKQKREERK